MTTPSDPEETSIHTCDVCGVELCFDEELHTGMCLECEEEEERENSIGEDEEDD